MGTVLCTDVERKSAVIVFDLTLIVIRVLPLPKDYSLTECLLGRVIWNQVLQRCYGSFLGLLEAFWVQGPQHFKASPGTEPSCLLPS